MWNVACGVVCAQRGMCSLKSLWSGWVECCRWEKCVGWWLMWKLTCKLILLARGGHQVYQVCPQLQLQPSYYIWIDRVLRRISHEDLRMRMLQILRKCLHKSYLCTQIYPRSWRAHRGGKKQLKYILIWFGSENFGCVEAAEWQKRLHNKRSHKFFCVMVIGGKWFFNFNKDEFYVFYHSVNFLLSACVNCNVFFVQLVNIFFCETICRYVGVCCSKTNKITHFPFQVDRKSFYSVFFFINIRCRMLLTFGWWMVVLNIYNTLLSIFHYFKSLVVGGGGGVGSGGDGVMRNCVVV